MRGVLPDRALLVLEIFIRLHRLLDAKLPTKYFVTEIVKESLSCFRQTMCGRYNLKSSAIEIAKTLGFNAKVDNEPRYNIAPSQDILVARYDEAGEGEIVSLRWGLIPSWVKDPKTSQKPINAKAETVAEKPFFRQAFKKRRCLVPANGFYEWRKEGKIKQPYLIQLRDDSLFFFAGLWEYFVAKDGDVIETALILTTNANEAIAKIHNRMPVILKPEYYFNWLDTHITEHKKLKPMLKEYSAKEMNIYPVSTIVNSAKNETPQCIVPINPKKKI